MNKHYSYGKAIKERGEDEIIVPDINKSIFGNLADLVRISLNRPAHKYELLKDGQLQKSVLKLAQYYKYDMNKALEYMKLKENDYMRDHYNYFLRHTSIESTRDAKQFALDETYHMLKNDV